MELPINKQQAAKVSHWLTTNFSSTIANALKGTIWTFDIVAAIACKETAYKWLPWIDYYPTNIILARCVFDASGEPEFPNNPRGAFPKNRDVFKAHYGEEFLNMLVAEGNKQRGMPQQDNKHGYGPAKFLYKGYGIFQYDLQNIVKDRTFFENKQWYEFDMCLDRLIAELNEKAKLHTDISAIVKAYNGAGIKAEAYAASVMQYREWV